MNPIVQVHSDLTHLCQSNVKRRKFAQANDILAHVGGDELETRQSHIFWFSFLDPFSFFLIKTNRRTVTSFALLKYIREALNKKQ